MSTGSEPEEGPPGFPEPLGLPRIGSCVEIGLCAAELPALVPVEELPGLAPVEEVPVLGPLEELPVLAPGEAPGLS